MTSVLHIHENVGTEIPSIATSMPSCRDIHPMRVNEVEVFNVAVDARRNLSILLIEPFKFLARQVRFMAEAAILISLVAMIPPLSTGSSYITRYPRSKAFLVIKLNSDLLGRGLEDGAYTFLNSTARNVDVS